MIKLGEGYYDEASIIAITPVINPCASDAPVERYTVYTVNGQAFRWDADAEEVQRTLEALGMIAPQSMSVPVFTVSELAELGACLSDGYSYAAKDEDGRVFAYEETPDKGTKSWINDDATSRIACLTAGRYAALSFADECPLDIAAALEGVLRC